MGASDDRAEQLPGDPLRLSASFLARALDSVAEAVIITDLNGVVEYWNDAACSLYEFSAAEAVGQVLRELIVPVEVNAAGAGVMAGIVDSGRPYQGEWLMRNRSGRQFSVLAATNAILDAAGDPTHYIGVSLDNSARKEAFRVAQTLANIVSMSSDSIITVDLDGCVTWANCATEGVLGWAPDDLVGRDVTVLAPLDRRDGHQEVLRRVLGGETIGPVMTACVTRDGSRIDVHASIGPLRDEQGSIVGSSSVVRDITTVLELRHDVERQAASFRARFDQAALPQSMLAMDGTRLAVNDAYCALVGHSRAALLNTEPARLLHASDPGAGAAAIATLITGQQTSASYEAVLAHRSGHGLPVLVDVTVLRDTEGEPSGMATFVRDLSAVREAEQRLATQQAMFLALTRRSSDVAVLLDAEANIRYVSASFTAIFDVPPDDAVRLNAVTMAHPDDKGTVSPALERLAATPGGVEQYTARIKDGSGEWHWVEHTVTNRLGDPDIGGLVMNLRDVTDQVRVQDKLQRSEARYRAIAETAQEGILVLDPTGRTVFANRMLADLLGLPLKTLRRRDLSTLFGPSKATETTARPRRRSRGGAETYEVPYQHPDGSARLLSISSAPLVLNDIDSDVVTDAATGAEPVVGSLAMVSDVTDARRAEIELRRQALHDGLTGLPNRTLLADRLEVALRRQAHSGSGPVALILLDLDQFKLVNDSYGHVAGDLLLVEVATRLRAAVRPGDTIARLGGDEFAVVCEEADAAVAQAVAERISTALAAAVDIRGRRLYAGASMGIALSPPHDASTLLRFADAAMYKAKAAGRGCIRFYDATLAGNADRMLQMMTALRDALAADRLELHYQPIIDIATGALQGVEALLRWTDELLGAVSPLDIVTAAETMGLSHELDTWVLRRACADLASLRSAGLISDVGLSVNVSARTVSGAPLDRLVAQTLRQTGWPAEQLVVEVTESALMTDPEAAATLLRRLRAQGVAIAVDDFGTGYSSLAYLKRLPVSILKIDRSFVDQVTTDPDSLAIASSIIGLADALGLRTIAEGIETEEQAGTLLRLECTSGQGYLWSPAVPLSQLPLLSCAAALTAATSGGAQPPGLG